MLDHILMSAGIPQDVTTVQNRAFTVLEKMMDADLNALDSPKPQRKLKQSEAE